MASSPWKGRTRVITRVTPAPAGRRWSGARSRRRSGGEPAPDRRRSRGRGEVGGRGRRPSGGRPTRPGRAYRRRPPRSQPAGNDHRPDEGRDPGHHLADGQHGDAARQRHGGRPRGVGRRRRQGADNRNRFPHPTNSARRAPPANGRIGRHRDMGAGRSASPAPPPPQPVSALGDPRRETWEAPLPEPSGSRCTGQRPGECEPWALTTGNARKGRTLRVHPTEPWPIRHRSEKLTRGSPRADGCLDRLDVARRADA